MSLSGVSSISNNNEITSNFDNIVGKLTLFKDNINQKSVEDNIQILERPATPLEQEIEDAPTTLPEFLYLLQRRIPLCQGTALTDKDQLNLLGIMEKEITLLWPELKNLLDYPLFNEHQNKELRSTIFVKIISKCKKLFFEYIEKMHFYTERDIFSEESNLVRIKLQLASDIRHRLHIPTLRRHIYMDISQDIHMEIPPCCELPSMEKAEQEFHFGVFDRNSRITTDTNRNVVRQKQEYKKENNIGPFGSNDQIGTSPNTEPTISDEPNDGKLMAKEHNETNAMTMKTDLQDLIADDSSDSDDDDCFPKMAYAMPSLKKHKLRNEDLEKKIEILKKENDDRQKSAKFVIRPPVVEQPCTIPKAFKNKIYYIPDIRPTERKNDYSISLSSYGTVWNELAEEISPEIVRKLDSNLFRGEEVQDIYKEIMSTVSRSYLRFSDDPLVEDCPDRVFMQDIKSSRTLVSESRKERVINAKLKQFTASPWKLQSTTRSEWEQPDYKKCNASSTDLNLKQFVELTLNDMARGINYSRGSHKEPAATNVSKDTNIAADSSQTVVRSKFPKRDYVLSLEKFEMGISRLPKLMKDRLIKQYKEWLTSWRNSFDSEDYMKYQSLQPSDFLSVVFHDYDSNDEYSIEDDEDLYPELVEQKHQMIEREKERVSIMENKVKELQDQKLYYEKGLWNPSIIFIGGLGKSPALTVDEKKELLKDKPSLPDPNDRRDKMSAYRRARSATSPNKPDQLFTRKKKGIQSTENQILNSENGQLNALQDRLEHIWKKLKMPNHLRLDMAIKYSAELGIKSLERALKLWDDATNLLLERETFIAELEKFERIASDPNRFFAKGYQGSSMARIEESKIREELNQRIDQCSVNVRHAMKILKSICSDELTYEGRPYNDKMAWDRTEMLYWLQEERKEYPLNGSIELLPTN